MLLGEEVEAYRFFFPKIPLHTRDLWALLVVFVGKARLF